MSSSFWIQEGSDFLQQVSQLVQEAMGQLTEDSYSAKNNVKDGLIFQKVKSFFEQRQWNYQVIPNQNSLYFTYQANGQKWMVFFVAHEPQKQAVVYSVYPQKIPEAQHSNVAEFITGLNYYLLIGNFEMDLGDGELRYRTSLDCKECPVTFALLQQVLVTNLNMMTRYFERIQGVIEGRISPQDAIASQHFANA
ncbi:YbjN domain-containing protein [Spirulina subsalsa FACHB-351]|uniref:YbjN domain-containing protein n=1 Tax=Spirulina subsalsa FACHB-351 TaxID=234711 RepID=A0ABT3L3K4_9CYAN|nr:YbjN domain-containing protein [Spirulina subsalsa]MCW6036068.1 YbjN domain-containing protein [Spirulina subsalsa FACHB-351]